MPGPTQSVRIGGTVRGCLCARKNCRNPSITMNDGSVNIAVEGEPGDLWFFWQDSSGAFHQETVDTSANLS